MARVVKISICTLFILFTVASHAGAAPEPISAKSIRYRIDLKNGADLIELMDKTQWLVDLQKTNLYRGLMIRMSGLFGALPSKDKPAWQGKLIDYILGKALSGRALSVWYFQAPTLVSPVGMSIYDLGDTEKAFLLKIVESVRSSANVKLEYNHVSGEVIPVSVSAQKVAIAFAGKCMGVSRDPMLALASAESCKSRKAPDSDALVSVNLESLSSSTGEAVKKILGFGSHLEIELKKKSAGHFEIIGATTSIAEKHLLSNSKISPDLIKILPASTLFYSTFVIPRPKSLKPEDVKAVLAQTSKGADTLAVTFFYLGMQKLEKDLRSDIGVLILQGKNKYTLEEVTSLFQTYYGHEVFAREVCKGQGIAISPEQNVLTSIDDVCASKNPNLSHASNEIAKAMEAPEAAHTLMLNLGRILNFALAQGIDLDSATDRLKSEEVLEAEKILGQIPAIFLSGKIDESKTTQNINYKASLGVF